MLDRHDPRETTFKIAEERLREISVWRAHIDRQTPILSFSPKSPDGAFPNATSTVIRLGLKTPALALGGEHVLETRQAEKASTRT